MSDSLQRAYAFLVDALRSPRKKAALETAVEQAVREVRQAIIDNGGDPDSPWIRRATLPEPFPEILHVTPERDTDDGYFFMAQEKGIGGLANGEHVGIYRLEGTGIVKVTTELVAEVAQ